MVRRIVWGVGVLVAAVVAATAPAGGVGPYDETKLTASDAAANDEFGRTVGAGGETIVVGAYQDDDNGSNSGAVYVFEPDGVGGWTETKLGASDGAANDRFGFAVAVSPDVIAVGADFDDDGGSNSGSAYAFTPAAPLPPCNGLAVTVDIGSGDVPTNGDDVILGTSGPDVINALDGNDTICALDGDDNVVGGAGDDTILGNEGNEGISGGSGNDGTINGDAGEDAVNGGGDNDNNVRCGDSNDSVSGNGGRDTVHGDDGNDVVRGGQNDDTVNGGAGDDTLAGNTGVDTCNGGTGGEIVGDTAATNCETVLNVP
ncbi:MAG: hypothetical protein AAF467_07430 [Actinomycetota bacterium]